MRFNTGTHSIVALVTVFAVSSSAFAGGRRVYMVPQQVYRSPVQTFRHDDALNELRFRATTGSRGLQQSNVSDIESRLPPMEEATNRSVVVREFRNERAGGFILAMAPQIAAAVMGMIKKFDESPNPPNGVEKADAIINALAPLLAQMIAQSQGDTTPATGNAEEQAETAAIPNVAQPTVNLTRALLELKAALKEYNDDQAEQKVLEDTLKSALQKIAEELQKGVPQVPAADAPPAPAADMPPAKQ
jgi:hypothetical protein